MSNILRRPMFRGGRVNSRGTGITSGLDYAQGGSVNTPKRGLVNGPGGYAGKISMSSIPKDIYNSIFGKKTAPISPPVTGGDITTKLLPNSFLDVMEGLGGFTRYSGIPLTIAAAPFYMDKDPLKDKPEEEQFQDTATMLTENFLNQPRRKLMDDILNNKREDGKTTKLPSSMTYPFKDLSVQYKEAVSPYADFDLTTANRAARSAEQKYFLDRNKQTPLPTSTDEDLAFATGIPIEKTITKGAGDDDGTGDGQPVLTTEEEIYKNRDLFRRLLGEDKARQSDIGDMLGRLSAASLKRPGRGDKRQLADILGDFMTAEVAAGPSRQEKIDQAAASLAINDYIAGKRSKEQTEQLIAKIKTTTDYQLESAAKAADFRTKDWITALSNEATNTKEDITKNSVIKNTLIKKFPQSQAHIIGSFEKLPYDKIDTDSLKIGFNIVPYRDGKIIIEKAPNGGIRIRTDLIVSK
jgi:hypothetical protein